MCIHFVSQSLGKMHTQKTKGVLINLQTSFKIHYITFLKGLNFLIIFIKFLNVKKMTVIISY